MRYRRFVPSDPTVPAGPQYTKAWREYVRAVLAAKHEGRVPPPPPAAGGQLRLIRGDDSKEE